MKIAIVYDMAYPFGFGGGEKRNWEVARRLAARGHEIELVTIKMWDGPGEIVRDGVKHVGVCPWTPGLSKGGKRSFLEPFHFARRVRTYLRGGQFDVVDCSNFPYLPCLAAYAAIRGTNASLVITWFEVRGLKRWLRHRGIAGVPAWCFELVASRLTRNNIAISEFTRRRMEETLGTRGATVVPCGVDVSAVSGRRAGQGEGVPQILYVGRLTAHKRVDLLIEAFSDTAAEFPDARLKIVGKGHLKEALFAMAGKLCPGKVEFLDSMGETELMEEYARSRMFVLPSEQEGFGIVLLEAMAAGTPVIALRAPDSAAASLVTHGHDGLLADSRDEMASAMKRLLSDNDLHRRISEAGAATAGDYDWDKAVVPGLERFYLDIVESKKGLDRHRGSCGGGPVSPLRDA